MTTVDLEQYDRETEKLVQQAEKNVLDACELLTTAQEAGVSERSLNLARTQVDNFTQLLRQLKTARQRKRNLLVRQIEFKLL